MLSGYSCSSLALLSSRNLGQEPANENDESLNKVKEPRISSQKSRSQVESDIAKNGKKLILGYLNKVSPGKSVFYPRKCIF